ncbi:CAP domain-containing protein [Flavobacterium granuli]|nr:CAP domain-containing protein [Flavobacterium granuli]
MDLINNYRVSIGLNSLVKSNFISSKAEEHNNYMLSTNILSHDNFNTRSQDIMKVLGAKAVGENVAYNSSTVQAAFDAWLASSGHKANIEGTYTHFGISIRVNSVSGRKYYTNIFAKI